MVRSVRFLTERYSVHQSSVKGIEPYVRELEKADHDCTDMRMAMYIRMQR